MILAPFTPLFILDFVVLACYWFGLGQYIMWYYKPERLFSKIRLNLIGLLSFWQIAAGIFVSLFHRMLWRFVCKVLQSLHGLYTHCLSPYSLVSMCLAVCNHTPWLVSSLENNQVSQSNFLFFSVLDGTHIAVISEVTRTVEDLRGRYTHLGSKLTDRKTELETTAGDLHSLEQKYQDLIHWLDKRVQPLVGQNERLISLQALSEASAEAQRWVLFWYLFVYVIFLSNIKMLSVSPISCPDVASGALLISRVFRGPTLVFLDINVMTNKSTVSLLGLSHDCHSHSWTWFHWSTSCR